MAVDETSRILGRLEEAAKAQSAQTTLVFELVAAAQRDLSSVLARLDEHKNKLNEHMEREESLVNEINKTHEELGSRIRSIENERDQLHAAVRRTGWIATAFIPATIAVIEFLREVFGKGHGT